MPHPARHTADAPHGRSLRPAVLGSAVTFAGSGFALASWVAQIPQMRDRLGLQPSGLGLVILAIAVGSLIALPLSGWVIDRFGSRLTVIAMALLLGVALVVVAIGYHAGVAVVVVGLFLLGFANGAWDVAMNVQGVAVERRLGRSILSRFHAAFSLGTVAGALLGAAAVALAVPVALHLVVVGVVTAAVVTRAAFTFLPDSDPGAAEENAPEVAGAGQRSTALGAWREPRTLMIGVFVLAMAFAEGAGNDWISVALIDGHGVSAVWGTLGFATFLTTMTLGRWFGPAMLDRFGRVAVVRFLVATTVVGVLLFVVAPAPALAYVGALFWGAGCSLGFPVGMSAAADDPRRAAGRVSAVASIGYCAFLAGPPAIGFLGDHLGVLHALAALVALLALAALVSGSVRPVRD